MSLTQLQEIPIAKTIMLVGPPGAGKSTFCQQTVLHNLAVDRPVIFVTTEYGSLEAQEFLKVKGLTEPYNGLLKFVDGYNQTVGLSSTDSPNTFHASSGNLNSLGIAIAKHQRIIDKKGILLVFDSLTSPYLLCGSEVIRFLRLNLTRFAADGNSVLFCFDEGSGKEEDLVGMMSISNGTIKINTEENNRIFSVVKHPIIKPIQIKISILASLHHIAYHFDEDYLKQDMRMAMDGYRLTLRPKVGDFINIAWRDLVFWSGMLWDPEGFPLKMYDITKYSNNPNNFGIDLVEYLPWHKRSLFRLLIPENFSKVKNMKKMFEWGTKSTQERYNSGIIQFLQNKSKPDEHYVRFLESYECWGFDNIGASLAFMKPAMTAGVLTGMEKIEREWNIIETKCIGLGDPYCEYKLVPREIDELKSSLKKKNIIIEKVNDRLEDHILGYILNNKPLMKRPTLGSDVHIHELQQVTAAPLVSDQLIMIFRMGGAKAGKMLGENLIQAGLSEDESARRLLDFMNYCKVGKVTRNETIKIYENSERFGMKTKEPSCYFTTGFLNGFFYAIQNQHVKEIKCTGNGDLCCEWEFR
jgi:predicted hydrocarbon binding protein/KaiC/GvpD/RAD55 family RecA-like ATPase